MAAQKTLRALLTLIASLDANGNTDLLTGTALGTSTGTVGTLTVTASLVSNAAGTSTGTAGVLSVPTTFVSSALGTSTGTAGTLTVTASFSGTASGVSSCSGTLTFASLSSTASGDSSGTTATITVTASLSGTCLGISSDTGALLTTSSLVGLAAGDSSGTAGVLTVEASWVSASASDSSGTSGSLTVTASLGPSTALGTSTGTGAILTTDSLVGRARGDSSGTSATLGVVIDFSSTANGRSRTLGRLTSAMSTPYSGIPDNVVIPNPVSIVSSTNTNPSVITVSAAHGLLSGDDVQINGHTVNTSINGQHPATVVSPTVFSVPVAGIGAGGATGTVTPLTCGAKVAIPSDGDDEDAASVNVSLEGLADRTASLEVATGARKLAAIVTVQVIDDHMTAAGWSIVCPSSPVPDWLAATSGGKIATIPNLNTGDVLEIAFSCSPVSSVPTAAWGLALGAVSYAPGATPAAPERIGGSGQYGQAADTVGLIYGGKTLSATYTALANGNVDLWLFGSMLSASGGLTITVSGERFLTVKVWRSTGRQ